MAQLEIPLISLETSTSEDVLTALSTVGFIHLDLKGTGLTSADVDRAFELSTAIHQVGSQDRTDHTKDVNGNGYFAIGGSLDERTEKADFKEAFVFGRKDGQTTQSLPDAIEQYRQEIVKFDDKCFEASLRVLDVLSEALDLPKDWFRNTHKDAGSNGMSFLNYPALEKPPEGEDIRAGSHKDWGDVTLLFQEEGGQPGLQIYLPSETAKSAKTTGAQLVQGDFDLDSGQWINAPIIPGTVLVNVGLTLESMTDGLCKANVHRVIFPAASNGSLPKNRKTIAYFSTPSHDVIMDPVKPGGIVMKTQGAPTVGSFFLERQRLAGVA